jgi:hypothetical protein
MASAVSADSASIEARLPAWADARWRKSPFFFPQPPGATLESAGIRIGPGEFQYSTTEGYEAAALLAGRACWELATGDELNLTPVEGAEMAAYAPPREEAGGRTLIVLPGAGSFFGLTNHQIALTRGLSAGSFVPSYVAAARQKGWGVLVCCPLLPRWTTAHREDVYRAHLGAVLDRCLSAASTASSFCLLAFSLGGRMAIEELIPALPEGSVERVALLDSVEPSCAVPNGVKDLLRQSGRQWRTSEGSEVGRPMDEGDIPCPAVSAGTDSHDEVPLAALDNVLQFLQLVS